MQLASEARARRPNFRLPRIGAATAAEFVLIGLVAVQCARLFWVVATPIGPVGDWRADEPTLPASSSLAAFDPFFRTGTQEGPAVVTSLDLTLH
ncbi:MAG: type II secretory pathway component PulC, partial [Pseudomonadota bacterium]|nr:type II secretory pathway component PulC [Pseudomonadota bacterium]